VTVSRRHAEFYRHGDRFTVRDVGSLNGTYVNRERIEEAELFGGDEVQIGKFRLLFLTRSPEVGKAPRTRSAGLRMTRGHRSGSVSIGQVLDELRAEFPDISPSKIRFLEAEGLIQPLRASSGYRRFAVADIERLRFILTAQRDEYLPLRVIKERLDALDGGGAALRRHRRGGSPRSAMTRSELLEAAGATEELLAELEDYGLSAGRGPTAAQALSVVRSAVLLAEYGIQPRHLRASRRRPTGRLPGRAGGGAAHQAEGQPRARAAGAARDIAAGISPESHL
jgi:DNA-binding transcriptional MerR regulator